MDLSEYVRKKATFTNKIQTLKILCGLSLVFVFIMPVDRTSEIQTIAGVLLGVNTFFIATAVLTGVLETLKETSKELYKKYLEKINDSINQELKEKSITSKLNICNNRIFLYQYTQNIELSNFRNALTSSFVILIFVIVFGLFDVGPKEMCHPF